MTLIEEFQEDVLPLVICFAILNVIGFFGNMLVFYIYSFRYRKNDFRIIVLTLCFVDLTSCSTTVPMETVSTWFWFNSPSRGLCKAKNFCVQFSALSAIYMLFVTAIYKYRRICGNSGKHLQQKHIVALFIAGICTSLALAAPAAIIWDINDETNKTGNANETLHTHVCEPSIYFRKTVFPYVYRILLSVYALFLIATIVLYAFVAKKIIFHVREQRRRKRTKPMEERSSTLMVDDVNRTDQSTEITQTSETDQRGIVNNEVNANRRRVNFQRNKPSSSQLRTAIIMVIIAGIFSVTFLSGLSFGYLFLGRRHEDYASPARIIGPFVCYRAYFVNYGLNPIVYFLLDRFFRKEVLKLLWLTRSTENAR